MFRFFKKTINRLRISEVHKEEFYRYSHAFGNKSYRRDIVLTDL